jgi:hypothetical protein
LLTNRLGHTFTGTVIEVKRDKQHGTVMIEEPAIEARVVGDGYGCGQEVLSG